MGIYALRFLLMLKNELKRPFTYIRILLIALSMYLVYESALPVNSPSEVYVINHSGEYGERVLEELNRGKGISAYTYTCVDDEDFIRSSVMNGTAECGFIFPEDLEERVKNGDTKKMIIMVTSAFSTKSAAVREKVFSALFRVMNIDIIESAEDNIFEDTSVVKDFIRERYDYYIEGRDLFGIEYEYLDVSTSESGANRRNSADPLRGCMSVLLFIFSLYVSGSILGKNLSFYNSMKKAERLITIFIYEAASVLFPAIGGFIMIRMLDGERIGFVKDFVCWIVFLLISCAWCTAFICFFKKGERFFPVIPVMVFISFLISPVFVDISVYVPVVGYVARLLPPAFYLYML